MSMGSSISTQNLDEWVRQQQQGYFMNPENYNISPSLTAISPSLPTTIVGCGGTNSGNISNSNLNKNFSNQQQQTTGTTCVTESIAAAAAAAAIASMASSLANDTAKRVLFPMKLWDLVSLPDKLNPGVTWTPDGTRIVVDKARLQKGYLSHPDTPFRTRSVDSFVRQLHFYGFRKTIGPKESDTIAYYYHDCFQRDRPELLKRMKRHYKHSNTNSNGVDSERAASVPVQRRPMSLPNLISSTSSGPTAYTNDQHMNQTVALHMQMTPRMAHQHNHQPHQHHPNLQSNFCRDHVACIRQQKKIDAGGLFLPSPIVQAVTAATPSVPTVPQNLSTKSSSLLPPKTSTVYMNASPGTATSAPVALTNQILITAENAQVAQTIVQEEQKTINECQNIIFNETDGKSNNLKRLEEKSLENVEPGQTSNNKRRKNITVYTITDNTKSAQNSDEETKLLLPDSVILYGNWNHKTQKFELIDAQFMRTPKSPIVEQ